MHKKNVIVIPARGGSEGIRGKNIQLVGDKPLVVRSLRHAQEMGPDFTIIVSTDSQEILNIVTDYLGLMRFSLLHHRKDSLHDLGPILLHYRSQEFADSTAIIGTALKSLRTICQDSSKSFNCWVLLQPTSPFRSNTELHHLAAQINASFSQGDSWVSVMKVDDSHPARMYELVDDSGTLKSIPVYEDLKSSRRQDLPWVYLRDGAFYCISDSLVAQGRQFSENPKPIIRSGPWTINIDNQMDLELARLYSKIISE
jgi:CMP-N,N'-diacetyllegionaminic acid synthase